MCVCVGDGRISTGSFIAVEAGNNIFIKTPGMIYHKDCFLN